MMESGNENRVAGVASKPVNFRDRQALKDIRNVVVPPYPSAINKRGLSEKNVMSKKPNLAIQRPITRKFAATLANKTDQISNGESEVVANEKDKKPASIMPLGSDKYSAIVVDYDQSSVVSDLPLPMVESSDEMEYEPVKEVVMEDLVMESAVDIDSGDSKNPLAVVDYVDDIYSYYKRVEVTGCVNPDYMSNQFDINDKMRAILIDWLIEVHYKFELMDETLYLTVNIIDRFLARQAVVRKKLQLVGVTAMLLACKYEEISVPVVDDLIQISDRAYTREEILQMERLMVNTLQFNMSVPTPYVFMTRYLKAAADSSDKKLELLSFYMIELCLVEYQMLKFQPSLLAAAAIYTAHCSLRGCKIWTKTSELYSTYSEDQLMECSKMMVDFHQKAGEGKLTGVFRKYSTFKFGCAAKSEPAIFLLDKVL